MIISKITKGNISIISFDVYFWNIFSCQIAKYISASIIPRGIVLFLIVDSTMSRVMMLAPIAEALCRALRCLRKQRKHYFARDSASSKLDCQIPHNLTRKSLKSRIFFFLISHGNLFFISSLTFPYNVNYHFSLYLIWTPRCSRP